MQIFWGMVLRFITAAGCCRKITSRETWEKPGRWSRPWCRTINEGSEPIKFTILGKDSPPPGLGQAQSRVMGPAPHPTPAWLIPMDMGGKSSVVLRAVSPLLFMLQIIYIPDLDQWPHPLCTTDLCRDHWNIWKSSSCFLYKLGWILTEAEIKLEISSKESLWHFKEVTLMKYELK